MITTDSRIDYSQLIREDRVHGSIYSDPDIFEDEMEQIFHGSWIFVGHASEVPEPGDYRLTWMGRQSVIMVRDANGEIQLLANRCAHRANSVCQTESGNANYFRCAYHGWTYKSNGDLVGVPYSDAYGDSLHKEELGLGKVPSVANYRGFIFASLNPNVMPFDEHLPDLVREQIDLFLDASPLGEIEFGAGAFKVRYHGNWKFIGMDGYHGDFTHQSTRSMMRKKTIRETGSDQWLKTQRDLGDGHVRLGAGVYDPTLVTTGDLGKVQDQKMLGWMVEGDWKEQYRQSMIAAYGPERGEYLVRERGDPHMGIFPNLQIIGCHLRVIRPVSVDETEVMMIAALLKGVPKELNARRLRQHEFTNSVAGGSSPDDIEMFERNQVGLSNQIKPWLNISRGLGRQRLLEDGTILAHHTDEATQRSMAQRWLKEMTK